MGSYLNIPHPLSTSSPPSPPPQPPQKPNVPMLYYGLAVVATAALVLAFYNLIIVRWCTTTIQQQNHLSSSRRGRHQTSSPHGVVCLISSFKYDKNQLDYNAECSVCLSVFEQGEEMRKLPNCGHSFHASCIDMWLYSHFDCPLCRAPVVEPPPPPGSSAV